MRRSTSTRAADPPLRSRSRGVCNLILGTRPTAQDKNDSVAFRKAL
jgi:hypothetical protein